MVCVAVGEVILFAINVTWQLNGCQMDHQRKEKMEEVALFVKRVLDLSQRNWHMGIDAVPMPSEMHILVKKKYLSIAYLFDLTNPLADAKSLEIKLDVAVVNQMDSLTATRDANNSKVSKMFSRTPKYISYDIIDYCCDPSGKFLLLIGILLSATEGNQLVNGIVQLLTVDDELTKDFEAQAASFALRKDAKGRKVSTLIYFISKATGNTGSPAFILRKVEHDARLGIFSEVSITYLDVSNRNAVVVGIPGALQISHRHNFIYVITKNGFLCVYDLPTSAIIYINQFSEDPILLTADAADAFYAVNVKGLVFHVTLDEETRMQFARHQMDMGNIQLAVDLNKRGKTKIPGLVPNIFQKDLQYKPNGYNYKVGTLKILPGGGDNIFRYSRPTKKVMLMELEVKPLKEREVNYDHKNILSVHEKFKCNEENIYITEKVDGGLAYYIGMLIKTSIKERAYFDLQKYICDIMRQIFEGISYLHSKKMCCQHLSMKNILFCMEKDLHASLRINYDRSSYGGRATSEQLSKDWIDFRHFIHLLKIDVGDLFFYINCSEYLDFCSELVQLGGDINPEKLKRLIDGHPFFWAESKKVMFLNEFVQQLRLLKKKEKASKEGETNQNLRITREESELLWRVLDEISNDTDIVPCLPWSDLLDADFFTSQDVKRIEHIREGKIEMVEGGNKISGYNEYDHFHYILFMRNTTRHYVELDKNFYPGGLPEDGIIFPEYSDVGVFKYFAEVHDKTICRLRNIAVRCKFDSVLSFFDMN